MTTKGLAVAVHGSAEGEDMFADLAPMDPVAIKFDQVAVSLAALMSMEGLSRAAMAERCGWHRSRISYVLSGEGNLTLKTITEFAGVLGYDFDVVFRQFGQSAPLQPWERDPTVLPSVVQSDGTAPLLLNIQTPEEVRNDIDAGREASFYVGFFPSSGALSSLEPLSVSASNSAGIPLPVSSSSTAIYSETAHEYAEPKR